MRNLIYTVCGFLILGAAPLAAASPDARLAKASRVDKAGWIQVHLEGSPATIGFQHGYLLAPEIDDVLKMYAYFLKRSSGKDWAFYRSAANRLFWPKIDVEYRQEIEGIAAGLKARGKKYDRIDITALNGWMELAWYYVPYFDAMAKSGKTKPAGEHCSAFIATGSYTRDGKIVMAHNTWVDYICGERMNVIADIKPERGYQFMMDTSPGLIHSSTDFVQNSAGILYSETTIGGFHGYSEKGIPEFVRARKAAQYAKSIDDFARLMKTGNNGGYANDWLVGDTKTNEIAQLELGLKNVRLWRKKDGIFIGCNFPSDEKLAAQETNYDPADTQTSNNGRKMRWEHVQDDNKGRLDAEISKRLMADHYDEANLCSSACQRTLCGHIDVDKAGIPEAGWGPYYPTGAVQAKVTTAALAGSHRFWARMGHPCGEDFLAKPFFKKHPQYAWQGKFLKDMKGHPWELFDSKDTGTSTPKRK